MHVDGLNFEISIEWMLRFKFFIRHRSAELLLHKNHQLIFSGNIKIYINLNVGI